jgi:hypothetical protein
MLPSDPLFHCAKKKEVTWCWIRTIRRMLRSSWCTIRQTLLNLPSVMNERIVEMQHESPSMCPPALWMTNFGQRAKHTIDEIPAVHLFPSARMTIYISLCHWGKPWTWFSDGNVTVAQFHQYHPKKRSYWPGRIVSSTMLKINMIT